MSGSEIGLAVNCLKSKKASAFPQFLRELRCDLELSQEVWAESSRLRSLAGAVGGRIPSIISAPSRDSVGSWCCANYEQRDTCPPLSMHRGGTDRCP